MGGDSLASVAVAASCFWWQKHWWKAFLFYGGMCMAWMGWELHEGDDWFHVFREALGVWYILVVVAAFRAHWLALQQARMELLPDKDLYDRLWADIQGENEEGL